MIAIRLVSTRPRSAATRCAGAPGCAAIQRTCSIRVRQTSSGCAPGGGKPPIEASAWSGCTTRYPARASAALTELQIFHNDVAAEIAVLKAASGVRR